VFIVSRNFRFAIAIVVVLVATTLGARADHTLRLGEVAFDPAVEAPSLPDGGADRTPPRRTCTSCSSTGRSPRDAFARLRAAGVEPVRYVHPDTYVVWGRAADRDALRGSARIRWTGDFAPAYRVLSPWRERAGETLDHESADLPRRGRRHRRLGARAHRDRDRARTVVDDTFVIAGFRLPGALMRFAAAIPGVYSIQPIHGSGPRAPRSPTRSTSTTWTSSTWRTPGTRSGSPSSA